MPQELQQAGTFRGTIVSYALNEAESGAKSVYITVAIEEIYDTSTREWCNWREYDLQVSGDLWIVKKDGKLNQTQLRSLVDFAGWDGSFTAIVQNGWVPQPIQVVVAEDTYKDDTRYRINWINDYERVPGGGNVDVEQAKKLESQYGSQIRALCGNTTRNAKPPAGGGKSPQAAKPAKTQPKVPESPPDDYSPF